MAWRVVTENKYELAETWKGDSTKIEFQFPFPNIPGVEDLKALTTSLKYMMGLHTVAVSWILRRYLHYKIETDDGHIIQHGRVTMIFAGKQSEIEGELRDAGVEDASPERERFGVLLAAGLGVNRLEDIHRWLKGLGYPSSILRCR